MAREKTAPTDDLRGEGMELEEGTKAPAFSLQDAQGKTHKLAEYRGKTIVLYFYPKDDTPGCTIEACDFRDLGKEAEKKGVVVLGVSPDDAASHQKFAKKYSLPFPLLIDPGHEIALKYGVWGKKKFMGREYEGIKRSTFIIGPDGKIKRAMYGVNPLGHAGDVLGKI